MSELLSSITELDPALIEVGPRLRPVSRAGVEAVKASIVELEVMKDRIHVRKKRDGSFVLLAGLHRLTAVRELFWPAIPVVAWRCTDDWARLMEIDDNLAGAELTPLDTAIFMAERKRVYEKLHPETKVGAKGLAAMNGVQMDKMSVWCFAKATAEKFGLSDRHVRRLIAAGEALEALDIDQLRASEKPITLSDLQTLAKIPEPSDRSAVCSALAGGAAKNAAGALRALKAQPGDAVRSDSDLKFRKLADAWARCGKPARRRFAEEHADELRALLSDQDAPAGEVVTFSARKRGADL